MCFVTCILIEITLLSLSHDKAGVTSVRFTAGPQGPWHLADQDAFCWEEKKTRPRVGFNHEDVCHPTRAGFAGRGAVPGCAQWPQGRLVAGPQRASLTGFKTAGARSLSHPDA